MKQVYYTIPPLASSCYHKEFKVADNKTVCEHCGRIRVILDDGTNLFFYANKSHYFTRK